MYRTLAMRQRRQAYKNRLHGSCAVMNQDENQPEYGWTVLKINNLLEQQTCQSIERLHTVYVETAVSYQE